MDKIQAERMAVAIKENADGIFRPAGSRSSAIPRAT